MDWYACGEYLRASRFSCNNSECSRNVTMYLLFKSTLNLLHFLSTELKHSLWDESLNLNAFWNVMNKYISRVKLVYMQNKNKDLTYIDFFTYVILYYKWNLVLILNIDEHHTACLHSQIILQIFYTITYNFTLPIVTLPFLDSIYFISKIVNLALWIFFSCTSTEEDCKYII